MSVIILFIVRLCSRSGFKPSWDLKSVVEFLMIVVLMFPIAVDIPCFLCVVINSVSLFSLGYRPLVLFTFRCITVIIKQVLIVRACFAICALSYSCRMGSNMYWSLLAYNLLMSMCKAIMLCWTLLLDKIPCKRWQCRAGSSWASSGNKMDVSLWQWVMVSGYSVIALTCISK